MRAADRTDYIVQSLMEGGAMYEDGARSFLAEHDADRHAELLAQVEQLRSAARSAAVIFRSIASRVEMGQKANPAMLRENAASLDKQAGVVAAGEASPVGPTATQPVSDTAPPERRARYTAALNDADPLSAVIAVANDETDPVYRSGYAAGRMHAGAPATERGDAR